MSDETKILTSDQINKVLEAARSVSDDTEVQLGALARALVIGCFSTGVDKAMMLDNLDKMFEQMKDLDLSSPDEQRPGTKH